MTTERLTCGSRFPYKEGGTGSIPVAPTGNSTLSRGYPAVLQSFSLELGAAGERQSDQQDDGVLFAPSALAEVEALIRGHEEYVDRELNAWVYDDHTTENAGDFWRRMHGRLRGLERERDRTLGRRTGREAEEADAIAPQDRPVSPSAVPASLLPL